MARMRSDADNAMMVSTTMDTSSAMYGYCSATYESPIANRSSTKLSAQLLNGSGLVLATARVPAFETCALIATDPPSSATRPCTNGDASPRAATATSAPPTGRMTVWTASHAVSTHGILSATNSTRYSAIATLITAGCANAWNCSGNATHSNRAHKPNTATVA